MEKFLGNRLRDKDDKSTHGILHYAIGINNSGSVNISGKKSCQFTVSYVLTQRIWKDESMCIFSGEALF